MTQLSREYILRLQKNNSSSAKSGGGGGVGGGVTWSEMMAELSKKVDVAWFDQIFQVFDNTTKIDVNGEIPEDTSNMNIQSMFGFWTDFYVTALGNGGHAGSAIYLSQLADVNVAGVQNGQALVWNQTQGKWVAGSPTSGTVTSVGTGTGLTGGPITGSGTISIDTQTMSKINNALTSSSGLNASNINSGTIGFSYLPTMYWANIQITNSSQSNKVPTLGGAIIGSTCIECNSSGSTSGRGNEINNYSSDISLQYDTTNDVQIGKSSRGTNNLTVYGGIYATDYVTALSDIRKKDVEDFFDIAVDDVAKAPIIRYTWKSGEDKRTHVGSVAQYWQKVLPEAVPEVDGYLSMDYGKLALLSAIATARRVVELEVRVIQLENKLLERG